MWLWRYNNGGGYRKPYEAVIEELSEDPRVAAAARLGELWGTDPIVILNSEPDEWLIRYACAKVIEADRKRAESESR